MPKRKLAKKELAKPDEFISFTTKAFAFLKKRRNQVAYAAIVLAALAFAWWAWQKYQQNYERQAGMQLARASQLFASVLVPPAGGAQPQNQKSKIEEAIAALNSLVGQFPRSRALTPGLIYLGNAHYRLGNYDQAISIYQRALTRKDLDPDLRALVHNALGYASLAKGDYTAAASYFSQAAASPAQFLKEQSLFNQALAYEKLGSLDQAGQAYRQLILEFPTTPRAALARQKLAALKR